MIDAQKVSEAQGALQKRQLEELIEPLMERLNEEFFQPLLVRLTRIADELERNGKCM